MSDIAEMAWLKENLPTGLVPKNMDKFEIFLDPDRKVSLLLSASDTVIDGKTLCTVKNVIVKRKTGSYPKNEKDGDTVVILSHDELSSYADSPFIDEAADYGRDYFYQAFLVSDGNAVNRCIDNRRMISVGEVPALMRVFRAEPRQNLSVALYMDIDENRNGVATNHVIIRRKEGSYPDSLADGDLVTKLLYGSFHNYRIDPYVDFPGHLGTFFYRAFPLSVDETFSIGDANLTRIENGAMPADPSYFDISTNADGTANIFFDVEDSIYLNTRKIGDVQKVTVTRNYNRFPISASDGTIVVELQRHNLHAHADAPFVDTTVDSAALCYYVLFIESTDGRVNSSARKKMLMSGYDVLGFRVKKSESDPYARVEYTNSCENYVPMRFDTISGKTIYGSWKDSWILNLFRPVMLRYDGTVAYELDKDDQNKRKDRNASEVSDQRFEGNAMLEIDKVYLKCWEDTEYEYVQFSPYKYNDDFLCLAHLKNDGTTELDHIYHSLYEGVVIDGKLRSIAGKRPSGNMTMEEQIGYAEANGENWNISDLSTEKLLENILILLGKSTDTQEVFGGGNSDFGNSEENLAISGTYLSSGPFDGITFGPNKILWIENLFGNTGNRINGLATDDNGIIHVRAYPPYSDDLAGWGSLITKKNMNGFQSSHMMTRFGLIPTGDEGSNSTYVPDSIVTGNNGRAVLGGNCVSGIRNVGMMCIDLSLPKEEKHWAIGTFLTYK